MVLILFVGDKLTFVLEIDKYGNFILVLKIDEYGKFYIDEYGNIVMVLKLY